jgi:hypothetical protein
MLTIGLHHLCCMSPTLLVFCIPRRICTVKPNYKGGCAQSRPSLWRALVVVLTNTRRELRRRPQPPATKSLLFPVTPLR